MNEVAPLWIVVILMVPASALVIWSLGVLPIDKWLPEDFWMTANALNALVFLPLSFIFTFWAFANMIVNGNWLPFEIGVALTLFLFIWQFWIETHA